MLFYSRYVFILYTHAFNDIHLICIKTVPTIGIAGMYVLDKGIFWIME